MGNNSLFCLEYEYRKGNKVAGRVGPGSEEPEMCWYHNTTVKTPENHLVPQLRLDGEV